MIKFGKRQLKIPDMQRSVYLVAAGQSALWEGFKAVVSGYSDSVLVMGWERMDEVSTDEGNFLISCAADKDWESPFGHVYTGYYAVMAQRCWKIFGKSEDTFRRTLAEISVKHHGYARFNPFAQAPVFARILRPSSFLLPNKPPEWLLRLFNALVQTAILMIFQPPGSCVMQNCMKLAPVQAKLGECWSGVSSSKRPNKSQ